MFEKDLIQHIKQKPCLWNRHDEQYRDKVQKAEAWQNVAKSVNMSAYNCRKRWKSLRDRFGAEVARQRASDGKQTVRKKWLFFDEMRFLESFVITRNQPINVANEVANLLDEKSNITQETFSFVTASDVENDAMEEFLIQNDYADTAAAMGNELQTSAKRIKLDREYVEAENSDANRNTQARTRCCTEQHLDPFLGAIGEFFEKVPDEQRISFKMDILNYVYQRYEELSQRS